MSRPQDNSVSAWRRDKGRNSVPECASFRSICAEDSNTKSRRANTALHWRRTGDALYNYHAYTFLKFVMVWILVLLADFILEFRFEYLWPCWLFFGSVYSTFHCHGLVICMVFVCAAFTLDVFCLIFVPLHWLFLAASTYVLFNYIWHTEKGLCMSTVSLWILLVYTEALLRFKDLRNSHANLSHLFAAHCIGYPVVYLGFDATCYLSSVVKLRTQRAVRSENDFHMRLLQQSLPTTLQLYPKCVTEGKEGSKWRVKADLGQYQCQGGTLPSDEGGVLDCLQIGGSQRRTDGELEEGRVGGASPLGLESEPRENLRGGGAELADVPCALEGVALEEQGAKPPKTSKLPSPRVRRPPNGISSLPSTRPDRKQKGGAKTTSPNRETLDRSSTAIQSFHSDQITKLQQDLRRLKAELQASRQTEQELRSHVCNLTNSERSLRPELSLLRQANQLLQSKILCLVKSKQKDKQASAVLEKKVRVEVEARSAAEKQLTEIQSRKLDEPSALPHTTMPPAHRQDHSEMQALKRKAKELETEFSHLQQEYQRKEGQTVALEKEVEVLCKQKGTGQEAELLLSALSALQDKTQHLEYNLSAETRIKLDLFSALGHTRRQLEIAQGTVMKQDQEIGEMKQKIAEVMAVMPGVTYAAPPPIVPQYLTKFPNVAPCRLEPGALMYQCLKK
ncbi:macoilin-1 isoform X2 [Anguilla rostrata]|uniref:macoilin-1 isoform X2 n=1 Tax=Anguilla rostrata TaxID=7938 RepID=UPI0030CAE7CA